MEAPRIVKELAAQIGATIDPASVGRCPDGSGFCVMSMPLPADHWLTAEGDNEPPAPMRIGTGQRRLELAEQIRAAARYAVRASTMNGKEMDFGPDAMVQNMVVGLLGYWTSDGTSTL